MHAFASIHRMPCEWQIIKFRNNLKVFYPSVDNRCWLSKLWIQRNISNTNSNNDSLCRCRGLAANSSELKTMAMIWKQGLFKRFIKYERSLIQVATMNNSYSASIAVRMRGGTNSQESAQFKPRTNKSTPAKKKRKKKTTQSLKAMEKKKPLVNKAYAKASGKTNGTVRCGAQRCNIPRCSLDFLQPDRCFPAIETIC